MENLIHIKVIAGSTRKADAAELFSSMTKQLETLITQLLWWAHALKNVRK